MRRHDRHCRSPGGFFPARLAGETLLRYEGAPERAFRVGGFLENPSVHGHQGKPVKYRHGPRHCDRGQRESHVSLGAFVAFERRRRSIWEDDSQLDDPGVRRPAVRAARAFIRGGMGVFASNLLALLSIEPLGARASMRSHGEGAEWRACDESMEYWVDVGSCAHPWLRG